MEVIKDEDEEEVIEHILKDEAYEEKNKVQKKFAQTKNHRKRNRRLLRK